MDASVSRVVTGLAAALIGFIRLIWKYVSGDWIVYSYGTGLFWLHPHVWMPCSVTGPARLLYIL
ncbi:MAG: hypothetical protein IPJ06_14020 [Saprospiraceae bacterium]|nr:hypothetical protein [Saprospiraceae bacterium]